MKIAEILFCAAACVAAPEMATAASGTNDLLPSRGAATFVAEGDARVIDVAEFAGGEREILVEVTGLTRNLFGQSAFDKMRARCLISFRLVGGASSAAGACSETDGDGDVLFTSFDGAAGKMLGGTGKYFGMTGTAAVALEPWASSAPSVVAYSVKHDVNWAFR